MLLDIKRGLQKGGNFDTNDFLSKIDRCISKVIPYVNVYGKNKMDKSNEEMVESTSYKSKSVIVGRSHEEIDFDSENFIEFRKSMDEDIKKVQKSFAIK